MKRTIVSSILLAVSLTACNKQVEPNAVAPAELEQLSLSTINQSQANQLANDLKVNYRVITNIPSDKCDQSQENGLCFEASISFTASKASLAKDWYILFSHLSLIHI